MSRTWGKVDSSDYGVLILYRLLTALILSACVWNAQAETLDEAKAAIEQGHFEQAFKIYTVLAKQGDAKAQYNLGMMYESGDGVEANMQEAANWFKQAADQGYAEGQYALGAMVFKREIDSISYPDAAALYQRAALQGHIKSQLNLGMLYYRGEVLERDAKEAVKWLQLAAEQDNDEAESYLGFMYANGDGVEENLVKAATWMMLAVDNQDTRHKNRHAKLLNFTLSKMTAEQIEQAKNAARACKQHQFKAC